MRRRLVDIAGRNAAALRGLFGTKTAPRFRDKDALSLQTPGHEASPFFAQKAGDGSAGRQSADTLVTAG